MYILPMNDYQLDIFKTLLSVKRCEINIEIVENVANVSLDVIFLNSSSAIAEGIFFFPLLDGGKINTLSLEIDGTFVKGEILRREEAYNLYMDMVEKIVDPALLEYTGEDLYKLYIAPINPNEEKNIKLTYTAPLRQLGNTYLFRFPLKSMKFYDDPVEYIKIRGIIRSNREILTIYSPYKWLEASKNGKRGKFAYIDKYFRPQSDFSLYISYIEGGKKTDTTFLAYESQEEDYGYFFLSFSACEKSEEPKDLVLVFDSSGSMEGKGIHQTKKVLSYIIDKIKPQDRVRVFTFDSDVYELTDRWYRGSGPDKEILREKIQYIKADSLTNIYDALSYSLSFKARKNVPQYVIFLTDGEPTEGIVDKEEIEKLVRDLIRDKRLFIFGVGDDIDTEFLSSLYKAGRGDGDFLEIDDISESMASFYEKIQEPVLSNVAINFSEVFKDIYPKESFDLFYGRDHVILGRYKKGIKNASFDLNGTPFSVDIIPGDSNDFIPYMWASRKIGHLLERVRIYGENKEIIDEIIRLSRHYGIMTPYTSLVTLEKEISFEEYPMSEKRELIREVKLMEVIENIDYSNIEQEIIGDRVFTKRDKYWVDLEYKEGEQVDEIKMFSNRYKELVKVREIVKILALGRVIFRYRKKWLKIVL